LGIFSKEGINEIIVLLGDTKKGRRSDVKKLVAFSNEVTPGFLVADEGEIVDIAKVRHGEFTKVGLAVSGRTVAYPASRNAEDIQIDVNTNQLEAPLKKGDKAGSYTVYCNEVEVGDYDLIVTDDIQTGWWPSYFYISNQQTIEICKYLGGALAVIILLVLIRRPKKPKEQKEKYESKH
jgi:D-alanyl-D-alanine carboxypeptidase